MDIIYMHHTIDWLNKLGKPISIENKEVVGCTTYVKLIDKDNGG